MQKILSIGTKQFLTGLAPSAHSESGGLFFAADGVTPLYDAGGTASVENGLLQAGPSPTDFTNTIADKIIAGREAVIAGTAYLWMMGSSGHFYNKQVGALDLSDFAVTNQISNTANGLEIWGPAGGTTLLYYWQTTQIGTFDMTGNNHPASPDAHWTDNVYTGLTSTFNHPTHQFLGNVYYGNSNKVGALLDNGAGGVTHSLNVLDVPNRMKVMALADDGTYLVVATTTNAAGNDTFSENRIYFWDTFSSSWTREYEIRDRYIYALVKLGSTVYAFGQFGIYECTFNGVRKVLSRNIGFGTTTDVNTGYGAHRAIPYNNSALVFATDTTLDSFGKLSPDVPSAHFKYAKIASGRPTFISASLDSGRVYVATTTPKFYSFDFNTATRSTGVSAQTVYFPLPQKYNIERVDVILGEPLVSGDSATIQLKSDEDTSASTATSLLTASYAADGAIRTKALKVLGMRAADQLSAVVNFVAGAVKIKRIDVWGSPVPIN